MAYSWKYAPDKSGKRYGRLVVIKKSHSRKAKTIYLCKCDCGKECFVSSINLATKCTQSCGCLKGHHKRIHGGKGTAEHKIWMGMTQRCYNAKSTSYKGYGSRGIKMSKPWREFKNFIRDMGKRPDASYSIDRINNDKGYSKSNCRWATRKQQQDNKRTTVFFKYKGT